jgi:putative transposase
MSINSSNQVWEMDITYIPMEKGFMDLATIIDVNSRYVLSWDISTACCRDIVKKAISKNGTPKIFNTNQGSQFTSEIFTQYLHENKITTDRLNQKTIVFWFSRSVV